MNENCTTNIHKELDINSILFNSYSSKCEPYYIERNQDSLFNKSLKISNVWIFGKSGAGKTTLIQRNLIQDEVEYCYCDLSPISINTSEDVLKEILCTIEDRYDAKRNPQETNLLKQINQIICSSGFNKTVIVIDELSVSDTTLLKSIASDFIKLVVYFNCHCGGRDLKFVISTICEPWSIIQNKLKASDYFQYISCDDWEKDSPRLFNILCKALNIDLKKSEGMILDLSRNSPRTIKAIIRKIIIHSDTSDETINNAIKFTLREVVG